MLHLCAGFILNLSTALYNSLADLQFSQNSGQSRVANRYSFFLGQFFMHPLDKTITFCVKTAQKGFVNLNFVVAASLRNCPLPADDGPDCFAAYR